MFTILSSFFLNSISFFKNNLIIICVFACACIGLYLFHTVSYFIEEKQKTELQLFETKKELSETKNDLLNSIKTANENASALEEERKRNSQELEELNKKHKEDMDKKQFFTIIKEKIKHEKDSDFIAPVLRNTIDRLYSTSRTEN